jgi:hypothetical protein
VTSCRSSRSVRLRIATLGFSCALTLLENDLRDRSGPGFIERYLDGVLYPDEYLTLSRMLAATVVVVGYTGVLVRWQRRRRHAPAEPAVS